MKKAETIACPVKLNAQQNPDATTPGFDFGQITCSGPLGFGMQDDTFTITPTSPYTGRRSRSARPTSTTAGPTAPGR